MTVLLKGHNDHHINKKTKMELPNSSNQSGLTTKSSDSDVDMPASALNSSSSLRGSKSSKKLDLQTYLTDSINPDTPNSILNTPPASDFKYSDRFNIEKTPNIEEFDSYFQISFIDKTLSEVSINEVEHDEKIRSAHHSSVGTSMNYSLSLPPSPNSPSANYSHQDLTTQHNLKHLNYKLMIDPTAVDFSSDSLSNLNSTRTSTSASITGARRSSSLSSTYSSTTKFEPNLASYRFLLVDDNPINLKVLSKILSKLYPNAIIKATPDPAEVLNILSDPKTLNEERIDILFLDIEMPEISGIDIAKKIRHRTSPEPADNTNELRSNSFDKLSLIAVTSRSSTENLKEYENIGFDLTLPKPLSRDYHTLINRINNVIFERMKNV